MQLHHCAMECEAITNMPFLGQSNCHRITAFMASSTLLHSHTGYPFSSQLFAAIILKHYFRKMYNLFIKPQLGEYSTSLSQNVQPLFQYIF